MIIKTECELFEHVANRKPIFYKNPLGEIHRITDPFITKDRLGGNWDRDWIYFKLPLTSGRLSATRKALEPLPEIRVGMCVGSRSSTGSPGLAKYIILAFDDKTILAALYHTNPDDTDVVARQFDRKDGQTRDNVFVSLDLKKEIKL